MAAELSGLPLELARRATNVFDRDGVNSRLSRPCGFRSTSEELIPPRQVVASIRRRF